MLDRQRMIRLGAIAGIAALLFPPWRVGHVYQGEESWQVVFAFLFLPPHAERVDPALALLYAEWLAIALAAGAVALLGCRGKA